MVVHCYGASILRGGPVLFDMPRFADGLATGSERASKATYPSDRAQVLIGRMLVVVVVGNWHGDGVGSAARTIASRGTLPPIVGRRTTSPRAGFTAAITSCAIRQIHRSAHGVVAGLVEPILATRGATSVRPSAARPPPQSILGLHKVRHALLLGAPVDPHDQPQVQVRHSLRRHHIARVPSCLSGCESVDIQRRRIDRLDDGFLALATCPSQNESISILSILGHEQSIPFRRRERLDAVVEVWNQHAAVLVLHGGEQARQHHRRIRRPVAVVPAVQFVVGP